MLGLYVSGHPLHEYEEEILEQTTINSSDLGDTASEGTEAAAGGIGTVGKNLIDGMLVTVGGIVTEKKTKTTKNNNLMAFVTLEDLFGSMEIIVFPTVLSRYGDYLIDENAVFIDGRISIKEDEQPKIICDTVRPIKKKQVGEAVSDKLFIKTQASSDSKLIKSTISLLQYFKGNTPVCFCGPDETGNITRLKTREYRVELGETLHRELVERFGEENVKIVSKYR
jgi:DNA polymerase-3 subunit alpha